MRRAVTVGIVVLVLLLVGAPHLRADDTSPPDTDPPTLPIPASATPFPSPTSAPTPIPMAGPFPTSQSVVIAAPCGTAPTCPGTPQPPLPSPVKDIAAGSPVEGPIGSVNYPVSVASLIPNVPISGVEPPAITCEPDYNDRDDRGLSPGANDRDTNCRVVGFGSDVGGAGVVDCEGDGDNDDMGRPAGRNDLDLKCRDVTAPPGGGVQTCALDEPITVYLVGGGGDAVLIPLDHTNVLSVGPQSLTFTVDPNTGLASLLVEVLNPAAVRDGLTVDAVWPDEGVRRSIELIPPAASHGVSGSEAPPMILPTPEATATPFPEQPPGFAGEQGEVAPNLTATAVTALIQENCP